MTRTKRNLCAALALAFCLAACSSSPPSHYYRLTAAPPTAGGQQPALGIGPIDIAEFLNRDALVYSRGGNRLQINHSERWAEPLRDGVKRVMGANLAMLMRSENIRYFPWDLRSAPDYGIRITILDLDADSGRALLIAEWLLYRPNDGSTIVKRINSFTRPLPGEQVTVAELPAAYSALLLTLSETIAEAIREDQQNKRDVDAGNEQPGA